MKKYPTSSNSDFSLFLYLNVYLAVWLPIAETTVLTNSILPIILLSVPLEPYLRPFLYNWICFMEKDYISWRVIHCTAAPLTQAFSTWSITRWCYIRILQVECRSQKNKGRDRDMLKLGRTMGKKPEHKRRYLNRYVSISFAICHSRFKIKFYVSGDKFTKLLYYIYTK